MSTCSPQRLWSTSVVIVPVYCMVFCMLMAVLSTYNHLSRPFHESKLQLHGGKTQPELAQVEALTPLGFSRVYACLDALGKHAQPIKLTAEPASTSVSQQTVVMPKPSMHRRVVVALPDSNPTPAQADTTASNPLPKPDWNKLSAQLKKSDNTAPIPSDVDLNSIIHPGFHGAFAESPKHLAAEPGGTAQSAQEAAAASDAIDMQIPANFKDYKVNERLKSDLLPVPMGTVYSGALGKHQVVQAHWVITSCFRPQFGRVLATTLISGVFNGLFPASISIVWCKSYIKSEVPSILYNLRHSHSINIFFMSPRLEKLDMPNAQKTHVSALMVPTVLQAEHLPLIITEDDVVFAPDANALLSLAYKMMSDIQKAEPHIIFLYRPTDFFPLKSKNQIVQPKDDANDDLAHMSEVKEMQLFTAFSSQGTLTSPSMTAMLVRETMKALEGGVGKDLNQDLMTSRLYFEVWKCNQPGSHCHFFTMNPSIVQHTGTASSLYTDKGVNQKWHNAVHFPIKVAFPGFDKDGLW